jgi:hypothetical protein
VLRNTVYCSIALAGMLLDSVSIKMGRNLRGSAATPIATCR